jgi:hypothetical protein
MRGIEKLNSQLVYSGFQLSKAFKLSNQTETIYFNSKNEALAYIESKGEKILKDNTVKEKKLLDYQQSNFGNRKILTVHY